MAAVLAFFPLLPAPAPAAAQQRTVRVGVYQNSPKVFVDANGRARGIFVDIVDEIARIEGWKVDYRPGAWTENIRRLENGEIDLLVDVSYSLDRARRFTLSRTPVLESWLDVYAKRETPVGSVRDLDGKRIAVLEGSVQEQYLRDEIGPTFKIDFSLLRFPDYPACIQAVRSGAADMMVATRFFSFSTERHEDVVAANIVFRPENLHLAFSKGIEPGLVEAVDRDVAMMKNNPESAYYQSLRRWLDIRPRALVPVSVKVALAVATGLLGLIGVFAFCLQRQVNAKTAALRETHRLLLETQAIAALGGWEYDVRTRRVSWTDELYRIYGVERTFDPNDVQSTLGFYAPQAAAVLGEAVQRAAQAGEPFDLEMEATRRDGERIWVRNICQPVKENGRIVRVAGNTMDITKRKREQMQSLRLQEQLIQAKKMEVVGQLAGGVAHDFNNMLNVINGYAELALQKAGTSQPLRGYLGEILNAATRSTEITRQLLAFARKQPVAPVVLDLNEAVGGTLKMLRRLIGEDVEVAWHPGAGLWPVRIDPAQLDQVLANLCLNARDAIDGAGKITIETGNVEIDAALGNEHPGAYVLLAVSDDGCGMDPDTREKIFEPFFTTKAVGKGTGLGLATVFGIVRQNDGFINVYSEPRHGSVFKIYLPRHAGGLPEPPPERSAEPPRSAGETVLLVEDEAAVLGLTKEVLEQLGYTVLATASPEEAVRIAETHPGGIDLLLTDVIMPLVNGRELSDRIGAIRPDIKRLYMSGYTANVLAHRGALAGGVQFIQKPFSVMGLAAKLRAALGGTAQGAGGVTVPGGKA